MVTGSATLLTWGKTRVLVDCGMFQGPEEVEQRNFQPFPFRPAELSAVVVMTGCPDSYQGQRGAARDSHGASLKGKRDIGGFFQDAEVAARSSFPT